MLEKLVIKGFQCHEELRIELSPSITCLTGNSDVGKTAIIRALRWLTHNRPGGAAYIRNGETCCLVRLTFDGGKIIVRRKDKGENEYRLGDRNYHAFGSEVPDDIKAVLNIGDENFARQLDAPFWFSLSPGEVSKQLNAIVNLDLIDKTLANLASESRKAKVTVEVAEDRLKDAREKRKGLAWAEEADESLSRVELQLDKLKLVRNKRLEVASAIEKLTDIESNRDRLLGAGLAIATAVKAGERVVEIGEKATSLVKLLDSLIVAAETSARTRAESLEIEARLKKEIGTECPLCGK